MALVKCRECGEEVSDEAITCPHCGVNNPSGKKGCFDFIWYVIVCLAVAVLLVIIGRLLIFFG